MLEWILIHFKPDNLRLIRCRQQFSVKVVHILSDAFPMFLIFSSCMSIMTIIGRIRIIARRWVGRFILQILTTLFLLCALLFHALESDDNDFDESYEDCSGSRFTSGLCVLLNFELSTDRVI